MNCFKNLLVLSLNLLYFFLRRFFLLFINYCGILLTCSTKWPLQSPRATEAIPGNCFLLERSGGTGSCRKMSLKRSDARTRRPGDGRRATFARNREPFSEFRRPGEWRSSVTARPVGWFPQIAVPLCLSLFANRPEKAIRGSPRSYYATLDPRLLFLIVRLSFLSVQVPTILFWPSHRTNVTPGWL